MKERRPTVRWTWVGAALLPLLVLSLVFAGGAPTAAQDSTPESSPLDTPPALSAEEAGRPAHIHSGTCEQGGVGPVVQALNNVTVPDAEAEGQELALPAESSFTSVPLTLDDILAVDHVVNVHLSGEDFDLYIACGEIGGPVDEDGTLAVALKQANDSGFTGVAFFAPDANGVATNVSLFLTEGALINTDTSAAASPAAVQATEEAEEGDEGGEAEADATQEAELEDADATREAQADREESESEADDGASTPMADEGTPTS